MEAQALLTMFHVRDKRKSSSSIKLFDKSTIKKTTISLKSSFAAIPTTKHTSKVRSTFNKLYALEVLSSGYLYFVDEKRHVQSHIEISFVQKLRICYHCFTHDTVDLWQ